MNTIKNLDMTYLKLLVLKLHQSGIATNEQVYDAFATIKKEETSDKEYTIKKRPVDNFSPTPKKSSK